MRRLHSLIAAVFILALTGCQEPPNVPRGDQLSFSQYQPFKMNVASIEFVDEYRSSGQKPNVELQFPTPPAEAMKIWVRDRVKAIGSENTMQVIIKDAGVKETALPRTEGLKGVFTNDQAFRYDARLAVEIRIYSASSALSTASVSAAATRMATLPENASVVKRDALFNDMTRGLMDHLNAELERGFNTYFTDYISYSY